MNRASLGRESLDNEISLPLCSLKSRKDLRNVLDRFNSPKNNITEPMPNHVMEKGKYYLALNSINIQA